MGMGECPNTTIPFYVLSEHIELQWRERWPDWKNVETWASFSPRHVRNIIMGPGNINISGPTGIYIKRIIELEPDENKWVTPRDIPCLGPKDLLASANVDPHRVSMIVIDAECQDFAIVQQLLKLEGFRPAFIQFERWTDTDIDNHQEDVAVIKALNEKGYAVGRFPSGQSDDGSADADNFLAVLTSPV